MTDLYPGDLLFHYGTDWKSRVIEYGTGLPNRMLKAPSHVSGVIPWHGADRLLLESTTLCDQPCAVNGKRISGVQAHVPELRISTYPGTVWLCSLKRECQLTDTEKDLLVRRATLYLGEPYDMHGAIESGTHWLQWLGLTGADLGSLFCSALWARLLMLCNRMNWAPCKQFNPAGLMRTVLRNGTHNPPILVGGRAAKVRLT